MKGKGARANWPVSPFAILPQLEEAVSAAAGQILKAKGGKIHDTGVHRGHEESSLDLLARTAVEEQIRRTLPWFNGTFFFESEPYNLRHVTEEGQEGKDPHGVLVIDELEGTTNAKRALTSKCQYRPRSCVSIALSDSQTLAGVLVSAVCMLEDGMTYSAVCTPSATSPTIMAFEAGRRLDPCDIEMIHGDSKPRVVVAGYSNSFRMQKAQVEEALLGQGLKVYDGCRASGVDLISIIRGQFDAYIDLRAYWSRKKDGVEQEAMLQVYDIAGSLPIAVGAGLKANDASGRPWQSYLYSQTIPLIVARPTIHANVMKAVAPFVEEWTRVARVA